jgi:hypothetical protein
MPRGRPCGRLSLQPLKALLQSRPSRLSLKAGSTTVPLLQTVWALTQFVKSKGSTLWRSVYSGAIAARCFRVSPARNVWAC